MTDNSSGYSGIQKQAMDAASQNLPWRKDVAWWVILIQGLVLTGLGLFVLVQNEGAARIIVLVVSLLLIGDGVMAALAALRGRVSGQAGMLNSLNAGIGIIVGALVLLGLLVPFLDLATAAIILALGLIVSGAISLVLALFMRPEGAPLRMLRVVGPIVWIVLGVMTLMTASDTNNFDLLRIIGIVSLVVGIVLLVLAFIRFRAGREPVATV
jgi:uncharacterized membrane protein HdeD (DUF308 family)